MLQPVHPLQAAKVAEQPDRPMRFAVAVTAIVKNEALYFEEWINFHRAIGVEHFFILNNASEDNSVEVLTPYINHGIVTLLHWPLKGGQIDGYNFVLRSLGHLARWMAFIDLDEFIVLKQDESLPDFLARFPDADQILIPWRNFGYSGHRTRPEGWVIENFTMAENIPAGGFPDRHSKAIVRVEAATQATAHFMHTCDKRTVNERGEIVPERELIEAPSYDLVQINHYWTKSYEEFEAKLRRGQGGGGAEKKLLPFERPGFDTADLSALRFLPRLNAAAAEMRALAPMPFRYGSRLRISDISVRNPFPWVSRCALSNHINRSPSLRIATPIDVVNRAKGNACLVRAEDHDFTAAPGELEASIHLRDIVRRVGGRVAWSLVAAHWGVPVWTGGLLARRDGHFALVPERERVSLDFPTTDPAAARCHAVTIGFRTPSPVTLGLAVRRGDETLAEKITPLGEGGTYLGVIEITKEALAADTLRVCFDGAAGEIALLDLVLIEYG